MWFYVVSDSIKILVKMGCRKYKTNFNTRSVAPNTFYLFFHIYQLICNRDIFCDTIFRDNIITTRVVYSESCRYFLWIGILEWAIKTMICLQQIYFHFIDNVIFLNENHTISHLLIPELCPTYFLICNIQIFMCFIFNIKIIKKSSMHHRGTITNFMQIIY